MTEQEIIQTESSTAIEATEPIESGETTIQNGSSGSQSEAQAESLSYRDNAETEIEEHNESPAQKAEPEPTGPYAEHEKSRRAKAIVQITVKKWSRNGLEVELSDGTPAFMPNMQIDLDPDRNIANYFGKTIPARITRVHVKQDGTPEISVSHRSVLEDDLRKASKERLDTIKMGDVIDVKVKAFNMKDVIVDMGPGVTAYIMGKDLTWEHFSHPYEITKRGDTIQAKVLQVDKRHRKVQLGVRQLTEDPYEEKFNAIKADSTMTATVESINDFGAEVSIGDGVTAFLPISEISWDRIPTVASAINVNDEFDVLVMTVDVHKRRITCSKKRLIENPTRAKEERYRMGSDHDGTIKEVTKGGLVVAFTDGNEGFVPRRELSHDRIERLEEVFKKDKPIEGLRVIEHDRRTGKITLSLIAAEKEAQRTTMKQYRATSKATSYDLGDQLAALKEKFEQAEKN